MFPDKGRAIKDWLFVIEPIPLLFRHFVRKGELFLLPLVGRDVKVS